MADQRVRRYYFERLVSIVSDYVAETSIVPKIDFRGPRHHFQRYGMISFSKKTGILHLSTHVSDQPELGDGWKLVYVADLDHGLQLFPEPSGED